MSRAAGVTDTQTLHATAVAIDSRAVLIRGASGSGKSGLALQLLAMGAGLVADDRTVVWAEGGTLWADAPDTIRGQIEARGVGILRPGAVGPVPVALIVDMDTVETARLPEDRAVVMMGVSLPVLNKSESAHFSAAVAVYLRQTCRE
ncbi:HPr kinase/phosphorylase [Roseovarius sp. THAF27]|uniref:HPr kinase/phosphorylase n=1 Tax=Roseovarius sp. THAF27 TaxID=2587850 RepID=UPI0012696C38|nr:HPr kinase/phosphatase C-terminal domain-containing protein [Roseovarius sp. THAF27]